MARERCVNGASLLNSCLHGTSPLPTWAEPQSPSYQWHTGVLSNLQSRAIGVMWHFSSKFQSLLKKLSHKGISLALRLYGRTTSEKHFAQWAKASEVIYYVNQNSGFYTPKGNAVRWKWEAESSPEHTGVTQLSISPDTPPPVCTNLLFFLQKCTHLMLLWIHNSYSPSEFAAVLYISVLCI